MHILSSIDIVSHGGLNGSVFMKGMVICICSIGLKCIVPGHTSPVPGIMELGYLKLQILITFGDSLHTEHCLTHSAVIPEARRCCTIPER